MHFADPDQRHRSDQPHTGGRQHLAGDAPSRFRSRKAGGQAPPFTDIRRGQRLVVAPQERCLRIAGRHQARAPMGANGVSMPSAAA